MIRSKAELRKLVRDLETLAAVLPTVGIMAVKRPGERDRIAGICVDAADVLRRCFDVPSAKDWAAGLPESEDAA